MPNHVTTVITASPAVIHSITRECTTEDRVKTWRELPDRVFDFEMFVPSPPTKETGYCNGNHEPGVVCWYSWNNENWGTKWGAYSQKLEPTNGDLCLLKFDTAWSHPLPVMYAVASIVGRDFPDEVVEVEYADEVIGNNVGCYRIQDGAILGFRELSNSDEGYELAAKLQHGMTYAEYQAWLY